MKKYKILGVDLSTSGGSKDGTYFVKYKPADGGTPSDLIVCYEKVPGNIKSLRLVAHYTGAEADKMCQILDPERWS